MSRLFKLASVILHGVVIGGLLIAEAFGIGPLPAAHRALAYDADRLVKVADIPLPPVRHRRDVQAAEPRLPVDVPPIEPPTGITSEPAVPRASANRGSIGDIENGGPGLIGPGVIPGTAVPPPPAPAPPIRLHSGIQRPRKIVDVAPVYPPLARAVRQEGVVILEAVIDAQGVVQSVNVLRGYPLLDAAAIEAVRQWRFTAALLNGQPVPVVMTVTVNFRLR